MTAASDRRLPGKERRKIRKIPFRRQEKKGKEMVVNIATVAGADGIIYCSNKIISENEVRVANSNDVVTSTEALVFIKVEQLDAYDRILDGGRTLSIYAQEPPIRTC